MSLPPYPREAKGIFANFSNLSLMNKKFFAVNHFPKCIYLNHFIALMVFQENRALVNMGVAILSNLGPFI